MSEEKKIPEAESVVLAPEQLEGVAGGMGVFTHNRVIETLEDLENIYFFKQLMTDLKRLKHAGYTKVAAEPKIVAKIHHYGKVCGDSSVYKGFMEKYWDRV